jgi:uncharacterized protein involved in copper resistance
MTSALTDADLTQMRADVADLLIDTCNILSVTNTNDGMGGVTQAWGTATASVSCRLDNERKWEQVDGAAIQTYSGWVLSLPWNTTISAANRVEHGGNTYAVLGEDTGKSWPIVKRVRVEKI